MYLQLKHQARIWGGGQNVMFKISSEYDFQQFNAYTCGIGLTLSHLVK